MSPMNFIFETVPVRVSRIRFANLDLTPNDRIILVYLFNYLFILPYLYKIDNCTIAVSYTHLDVYKRQL